MLVIHTPRSSFEVSSREQQSSITAASHVFDLPTELRVRIYEFAFTDVVSSPITIVKCVGNQWEVRPRKDVKLSSIPQLLLVSRRIYDEASDVLYRIHKPRITITHGYVTSCFHSGATQEKGNNTLGVQRIQEAVKPILQHVKNIDLEVAITSTLADQCLIIALLRWMQVLFNSRPANNRLRSLEVVFRATHALLKPKKGEGLFETVRGMECTQPVEVWFVYRVGHHVDSEQWEQICVPPAVESPAVSAIKESEEGTWKAFEVACRRADVQMSRYSRLEYFCSTLRGM